MPEYQIVSEMRSLIRSGFYSKTEILDLFCDEICNLSDLSPFDVAEIIDTDIFNLEIEKETWPKVTDCDRLDVAFSLLNEKGILTLQNAGNTQNDGDNKVYEEYENHPNKSSIIGYCFYHTQDLERAVRGLGLYLAFGPMDPKLENREGPVIGELIRQTLYEKDLDVEWDGTFNTRILLPMTAWQKR